ncbi:MAG TPA: hypothetical protein VM409_06735, partial [Chloroflexia bacterium]|nr:hypothetical protein [Chloroflexia bacterium]
HAAGGGILLWHGREYQIGSPVELDADEALKAFAPHERLILRANKTRDFMLARPAEKARAA